MLLRRLSYEQWQEWVRFAAVEPWGFDVEDFRQGLMGLTVASVFGGSKGLTPEQFMLGPNLPARWGESKKTQDELVAAKLKAHFGWKPPDQRGQQ